MALGGGENGVGILRALEPRTRALAVVVFAIDSVFGVSIFSAAVVSGLSHGEFEIAVIAVAVLLIAALVAITIVELTVERNAQGLAILKRSRGTPSSRILDALVNSTLEMICRATSLPLAPDEARVRAFIFKAEGGELVCRHYWAQNPTSEKVGVTRFPMTKEIAQSVAVVRCALDREITRTSVDPLPAEMESEPTTVERDLTFVLAAPILDQNQQLWGTIDFDTSNGVGRERLSTPLADAAIFQLTQHLQVIFSLSSGGAVPVAESAGGR